jgi:hypothetical protein
MANQFGHFSLGFIPTLICCSILKGNTSMVNPEFWAALIVSGIWLLFELYNFLGPLLGKRSQIKFTPDWANIGFDTFTDLCFFWLGAFSASLYLLFSWVAVSMILILIGILCFCASYWYVTKMYLQEARYPFQYRLSQWNFDIAPNEQKTILNFLHEKDRPRHLLVFGTQGSGKTSLCVGLGTELSIKRNACSYVTALKLYSMFFEPPDKPIDSRKPVTNIWGWRDSSIIIIDDINPGQPVMNELVSPMDFLQMMNTVSPPFDLNREVFQKSTVIWVLGSNDSKSTLLAEWRNILINRLGIKPENISSIDLYGKI